MQCMQCSRSARRRYGSSRLLGYGSSRLLGRIMGCLASASSAAASPPLAPPPPPPCLRSTLAMQSAASSRTAASAVRPTASDSVFSYTATSAQMRVRP